MQIIRGMESNSEPVNAFDLFKEQHIIRCECDCRCDFWNGPVPGQCGTVCQTYSNPACGSRDCFCGCDNK